MGKLEIKFFDGDREFTQEQIRAKELERTIFSIKEMMDLGAEICYEGTPLTREELDTISLEKAREALAVTKDKLANEGMMELFKDKFAQGKQMWMDIAAKSRYRENFKEVYMTAKVKGISLPEFMKCFAGINAKGGLEVPSKIYPEHLYFIPYQGGQIIAERYGQYGEPSLWNLKMDPDGYEPVPLDPDTTVKMTAEITSYPDGTDFGMCAMHQYKVRPEGFDVKLGAFMPEGAPDEMVEGHKWHFAVEFNNMFHMTAAEAGMEIE